MLKRKVFPTEQQHYGRRYRGLALETIAACAGTNLEGSDVATAGRLLFAATVGEIKASDAGFGVMELLFETLKGVAKIDDFHWAGLKVLTETRDG